MRTAFLIMCAACAALLSTLIFVVQTGRIPLRAEGAAELAGKKAQAPRINAPFYSEEERSSVDELIKNLNAEKEAVAATRSDLAAREESMKVKEAALNDLKTQVQDLQNKLSQRLLEVHVSEQANLRRLAEVYGKMDSAAAGKLLKEMDKNQAATILSMITERSAAGIIGAIVQDDKDGPARAAEWSDIMRRLKAEPAASPGE